MPVNRGVNFDHHWKVVLAELLIRYRLGDVGHAGDEEVQVCVSPGPSQLSGIVQSHDVPGLKILQVVAPDCDVLIPPSVTPSLMFGIEMAGDDVLPLSPS